ncbi:helix-hairpin-helix domain-containing protein [Rhodoferax sp.]|uniref:ComEA family DNA-binding protein n=1 Tax=Rhodoferax sp. TaxID=50421 RepID=UPI00284AFE43|nr:helix-hairpin-helix domain-containing protein [Rhodoferax sp.]MDR3370735.1 helix-hairpin-helix domain-containing protein [Rhodoferax sp.]
MLKKLLVLMAMLYAAACFAAVDVNKATAAELDSIKGIGPGISTKILDERKKGSFKDWTDFVDRVKGVGDKNAAKFSAEGLTVNGDAFKGAAPTPAKAKKADAKAAEAAPADAAAPAAAPAMDAKAQTAADKAAAKKAKADAKAAKAADKAAAKAKPAASAAK